MRRDHERRPRRTSEGTELAARPRAEISLPERPLNRIIPGRQRRASAPPRDTASATFAAIITARRCTGATRVAADDAPMSNDGLMIND